MLYHLSLAMYPRILSTFDEDLNPLSVSVRVGQAVDVVGQAGTGLCHAILYCIGYALRSGLGVRCVMSASCWLTCDGVNRQAQDHHWFHHQQHACAAGLRRARSTGHD